jgi:hypothetical protein
MLSQEKLLQPCRLKVLVNVTTLSQLKKHNSPIEPVSGTDVMILKIFSPKNSAKIGVFGSKQS